VVPKFALAFAGGALLVIGLSVTMRVQRETKLYRRDMVRDDTLIGRTIAGAVERTWGMAGEAAALDLVRNANERESHITIRWVWLDADGGEGAPLVPAAAARARPGVKPINVDATVPDPATQAPRRTSITYVPVAVRGARAGAIELRESLEGERRVVTLALRYFAITSLGLATVVGLVGFGLGLVLVERPMRRLVEQARRVGRSDLAQRLGMTQRDEIGELAREMDAMVEQLAVAKTELEAETGARLAAIEQLRHAERLLTVGQLAAGVAHELGTPINVVTGHAQLLLDDAPADAPSAHHARIILEQGDRMAGIIGQLLDFARPRPAEREPRAVQPIVQRCVTFLEATARKAGLRLELALAEETLIARLDAGQLEQAIANLLVNAIQATPSGGVVTVRCEPARAVRPGEGAAIDTVAIVVADTGPGLASEVAARMFEPFFTTKPVGTGTGLGLPVTYGLVREHDGWIDVGAAPGGGAQFTLHLPREEAA